MLYVSDLRALETLTVDGYQRLARLADQNRQIGVKGFKVPLLGLFGEVGSLLTLPKRKQREKPTYSNYQDSIIEEVGDVLWYLSNLASRHRISFSIIARARGWGSELELPNAPRPRLTFGQVQGRWRSKKTGRARLFEEVDVFELGSIVGQLLRAYIASKGHRLDRPVFLQHLATAFRLVLRAATNAGIDANVAAQNNLAKIESRWPRKKEFGPLFDEGLEKEERLPRRIEMFFVEKAVNRKTYVLQRCQGINIGDRLTDNKTEQDDYRFHDVFHLAYAAILGWSPVTRALFRVKRKSDPDIDENQDGARAILIEEGIATWIFNHAVGHHHFRYTKGLDYSLLKAIRHMVSGYEVDRRPLWQWEIAILDGFKVFRKLRANRSGLVIADLERRRIYFRAKSA